MTYRELIEKLKKVPDHQLEEEVVLIREDKSAITVDVWEVLEDHVNPSGEGLVPISIYQSDDEEAEDYIDPDEPVIVKKGCLLLAEGEEFQKNDEFMVSFRSDE